MTLTVEDDFGGFVAARWPDLEAVALVAAGDPVAARELTTKALASVGGRWDEVLDEGAPTRAARSALLREVARPARPGRRSGGAEGHPARPAEPMVHPDDDDQLARRLVEALSAEPPVVRARLAAGVLWECGDAETADLAGLAPGARDSELGAARRRLLDAHRRALAAEGLSPADWHVDRDLAQALQDLAAARPDPPDPAGLVAVRATTVRRRTLLTGGAAVVAAGTATWWVLRGVTGPKGIGTSPTRGPSGGADDAVWSSTDRWPPRGSLSGDPGIRALVAAEVGADSRLLFAHDVAGTRVVVAAVLPRPSNAGPSTVVAAWSGIAGVPADQLARVDLRLDRTDGVGDVVAVVVPAAPGGGLYTTGSVGVGSQSQPAGPDSTDASVTTAVAVMVVLARPSERSATWSPVVHPTVNGSVERAWTLVPLDDGVGARALGQQPGSAARIRVGAYDGPLAGPRPPFADTDGVRAVQAASRSVADATGAPVGSLTSEVVVDSPVAGAVLDAFGMVPTGDAIRIRVVDTTTHDGALVRSVHVSDDGRPGHSLLFGPPVVLRPGSADEPVVRRLDLVPPRATRFVVVAPGAATCQLLGTTPPGYPVSEVVPMDGSSALVPIANGQVTDSYRLVLRDGRGRVTWSGVPTRGRSLSDLDGQS